MDDFLVYARTETKHDERLCLFLNAMKENHVTLNLNKCEFHKKEVIFLGHKISESGVQPMREKIDALKKISHTKKHYRIKEFFGNGATSGTFHTRVCQNS